MKQKAFNNFLFKKTVAKPLWPWFSFIFVGFLFLLLPHQTLAANYTLDQVTFSLDTQVADSSGNYSNGNFIKLVTGQDLRIRAIFKLTGPSQGLNINTDTTRADSFTYNGSTAAMTQIGVDIRGDADPTNSNSGIDVSSSPWVKSYLTGLFVASGDSKTFDLTIPWSVVNSKLTGGFGSNTPNFLVGAVINSPAATSFWTQVKAGLGGGFGAAAILNTGAEFAPQKRVYVKIYPDQATANAASTPTDVQSYGGVSGNLQAPPHSYGLIDLLNEIVGFILGLLQELIYVIFSLLVAPLITALLSIHPYQDSFVAVIYTGWEVVRNLCNIFFIVALIIIAMATLFRVDSYKYKDLLVNLIVAALLVNFSLVIAQAVLGIADTVQAQFLPANVKVVEALAKNLMLNSNSYLIQGFNSVANDYAAANPNGAAQNGSIFGGIIQSFFWLALSLGTLGVFGAIAVFLLIRIVALWLLLMVSPVAYAVGVLPATSHYRDEWWKSFLKYAFFTPIMAFFLNMAAIMATNAQKVPILNQLATANGVGNIVVNVSSNILLLVFLIASLKVADLAGIYGASGITDIAKKGIFAPFAGAKYLTKDIAGGYLQKRYNNATAKLAEGGRFKRLVYAGLHPAATAKAFRKDASEEQQRSKDLTAAAALSVKRKTPLFRRKGEDPLVLYNEHKGKELLEERRGETSDSEQDEVKFALKLYADAKKGDKDAQLMLPEQMRRMFKNHNINEFVEQFGYMEGINGQKLGDEKNRVLKYNRDNLRGVLNEMASNGAMTPLVNEEYQKRLGTLGYASDDFTGNELTYTDDSGRAHLIKVEFNSATKAFEAAGQKDYDSLHEYARTHSTTQAEYETKVKKLESGSGPDFVTFQGANPNFNLDKYKNARQDKQKVRERNINISKKDPLTQVKQWWESQVSTDADGKIVFGATGAHTYIHLNSGHEFHGSRGAMVGKVQEKYLPLVIEQQAQLRKELEKAIKQEAYAAGKFLDSTQLEHEVDKAEYANMRMAYAVEKRDLTKAGLGKDDYTVSENPTAQEYKDKIVNLRAALPKSSVSK